MILQTSPQVRARPEFQQLLQRYEGVLSIDCGSFKDSCSGFRYLKTSSKSSAQVVKLIAQTDSAHYYKMLMYAIQLKNMSWDSDLITMLYQDPAKLLSQAEEQYRDSVKSMLATALQQARDKNLDQASQRQFLEQIHAWDLLKPGGFALDDTSRSALYSMIARAGMLYTADGSLQPGLQQVITASQSPTSGLMLAMDQNQLKAQNSCARGGWREVHYPIRRAVLYDRRHLQRQDDAGRWRAAFREQRADRPGSAGPCTELRAY